MNLSFAHLIPQDFNSNSKVWIYQAARKFTLSEALHIEPMLEQFAASWQSHGTPVKGYANLLFGQFVIIMADETATGVSGCSTDSSVRLIKQIEQETKVEMFNRQLLAFVIKDNIQLLPLAQLKYAFENNFISADTLYFSNLADTKEALLHNWIIPLKQSMLAKKLHLTAAHS